MCVICLGLQPDKKYEVRVLAATEQGWPDVPDEQLPWVLVETLSLEPDTPLLPQPFLQLVVINATTIQVFIRCTLYLFIHL